MNPTTTYADKTGGWRAETASVIRTQAYVLWRGGSGRGSGPMGYNAGGEGDGEVAMSSRSDQTARYVWWHGSRRER